MPDQPKRRSLDLFGPVSVTWDAQQQELCIHADLGLLAGNGQTDRKPAVLVFRGPAAAELSERIRTLAEHVDIAAIAATRPRDLQ